MAIICVVERVRECGWLYARYIVIICNFFHAVAPSLSAVASLGPSASLPPRLTCAALISCPSIIVACVSAGGWCVSIHYVRICIPSRGDFSLGWPIATMWKSVAAGIRVRCSVVPPRQLDVMHVCC